MASSTLSIVMLGIIIVLLVIVIMLILFVIYTLSGPGGVLDTQSKSSDTDTEDDVQKVDESQKIKKKE